jgi:hypothetical protein
MQRTVRLLGLEFLHIDLSDPEPETQQEKPPDCTTYPVGFVASPGDQRWRETETPDLE